jgi:gamma-glutamyltranspeptidase/glutathione hydrolase
MNLPVQPTYPSRRSPVLADQAVATSHPLATQAGLDAMRRGGNAVDAALAAAITLTVVEPTGNGLGSDAFALVWEDGHLHGLNASGRAPSAWTHERFAGLGAMPTHGWNSVTVPGAVSAWVALSERFGRLHFSQLFEDAIRIARDGFCVTPVVAAGWAKSVGVLQDQPGFADTFMPHGRAPKPGERFFATGHARSLEAIATTRGDAFYRGELAEALVQHAGQHGGALELSDLERHRADWVEPLKQTFHAHALHEIPPSGQGIVALQALGILERLDIAQYAADSVESWHLQIEAIKLAFADAERHVGDVNAMPLEPSELLDPGYLDARAALIRRDRAIEATWGTPRDTGTVYLTAADDEGRMVSFIQSNYMGFGSGVVVPGTGISLQNRGAGFTLEAGHPNQVGPGKRPFHTIIPAFLTHQGQPRMSFGVMGGPMQPQGHVQMVVRTAVHGQDPQTAADAPRWRFMQGREVALEPDVPAALAAGLQALGHDVHQGEARPGAAFAFGGAQLIWRLEGGGYVAGSDPRKDGAAGGF